MSSLSLTSLKIPFVEALRREDHPVTDAILYEMVRILGHAVRIPTQSEREEMINAVWIKAKQAVPKLDPKRQPFAAIGTTINRGWWDAVEREIPWHQTESLELGERPNLNNEHGDRERIDISGLPSDLSRTHQASAARARNRPLPPMTAREKICVGSFFQTRIAAAVLAAKSTVGEDALRIDGVLLGLQESQRYLAGQFIACETPLVKFTVSRRIPKGEA